MRYTDEGNLRFVGNTRTSTSTQGVYRQEFDSGKWAVTLTNTEPGLGYLGYNVEALSYDFKNCRLCTENIRASNVEVSGNISAPYVNVLDTIYAYNLESCCGLCFECGCISNGPAEIRIYGRPNCSPDDGCLVVADNYLCYCTRNGCSSITVDSTGIRFNGPIKADAPYLYVDDHLIASCLYADTSYNCHYVYGIRKNGSDTFTNSGILDIGTVGAAVNVNGSNYVAGDNGLMSLPNMATSVTLNNITTPVDSNGNIDLGTFTATVDLNNNNSLLITNCTFSVVQPVSSVIIGHNANVCTYGDATDSANRSVAIGRNASIAGNDNIAMGSFTFARCCSIATGYASNAADRSVAMGYTSNASSYSVAIGGNSYAMNHALALGCYARAVNGNIAIGCFACADSTCFNSIVTRAQANMGNDVYAGFGSIQIVIKPTTLECDLYNALCKMIFQNGGPGCAVNKCYLLLDKAIYKDSTSFSILGSCDYNAPIAYCYADIIIGNKMTVHMGCTSAVSLTCANSYEVWNILY